MHNGRQVGPYGVASGVPITQRRVSDIYGKQGGQRGQSPGCWDWSAYCGEGEFAEDFTLVFDLFGVNAAALASGASRRVTATVTPEGRFVLVSRVASVTPLGLAFSTMEQDVGSQRMLESDWVNAANRYGTVQRPGALFIPRLIGAQGSVTITVRNDGAVPMTAGQICYLGFKVLDMTKLNASIRRCV